MKLRTLVIPAKIAHTATVLILHGLGDSGHGWAPIATALAPLLPHVKFVLPHAAVRPITINQGMRMPGWYDISSFDFDRRSEDEAGLSESVKQIEELIQDEIASGITADRIVLGGFSQGAAMSLLTTLTTSTKLAGAFAMSGYLPLATKFPAAANPANKQTPIALFHGTDDEVVLMRHGKTTYDALVGWGYKVTWKEYDGMGHSASEEEVADLARFLKGIVA
ncbi:putative acyl-protein thioesterase [Gonapodya prolifera JEL478]|uniref:Acyl-protein thioesterase 1 n=1 Tax=Gonapodya prolifera (strain JEL478) TaxID=1344416 RepID=A0A139A5E1_GONPJ|nr:putative acyl-protein thioesterase [Gonapodya prolifera JEL478]|eukprot:KXS12010.1 putative acyl-protein thioesterase [Gonapodya prolifera JEL478]